MRLMLCGACREQATGDGHLEGAHCPLQRCTDPHAFAARRHDLLGSSCPCRDNGGDMDSTRKPNYRARVEALPADGPQATERALARVEDATTVVLVEGFSDQLAIETLAARHGHDLRAEGVAVLPIGGAHAALQFLRRF